MPIQTTEIRALREQRARLVADASVILEAANGASRDLTAEERTRFDALHDEADRLMARIATEERQLDAERTLVRPVDRVTGDPLEGQARRDALDDAEQRNAAFRAWVRGGMGGLTDEQRGIMLRAQRPLSSDEQRNLGVASAGIGGATVPQGFFSELERRLQAFGGMREAGRTIRTGTGATLPFPTVTDVANVATIVGENTTTGASVNPTFASVNLGAFTYRSLTIVSLELLQDSAFDVEGLLADLHGERLARGQNAHFTVGTGTGQPRGVVIDAVSGRVGQTGQTATVTWQDLTFLEHSVDPAYRANARFMFHDTTLGALKRLTDSQNRPLFLPGVGVGAPDTIMGRPFTINQDVAQMAANARSILFGDFSKYMIRDVMDVTMVRLSERYIDNGQIGFIAFARADGRLIDAGAGPVRFYQNSAT